MAAEEEEVEISVIQTSHLHMISAFLAMETPDVVISFARELGGGSITETVQSFVWQHCLSKPQDVKVQADYVKRLLKKLIFEVESSGGIVLDELYEQCASYMISLRDHNASEGSLRVFKTISFLYPDDFAGNVTCPKSKKLEVQLQCSVNMLEGDTGCSIWPSSLFLSEFILSFPELFANKCCFEVGSGVGLVGICLAHSKASKVILSDGDLSTLANMKVNLERNHLSVGNHVLDNIVDQDMVQCVCLPWESVSKDDLQHFAPDIILGADIIYDPSCLPHLVRLLSILMNQNDRPHAEVSSSCKLDASKRDPASTCLPANEFLCSSIMSRKPVAYIASVVRNIDTFNYFLELAEQANLIITDLTQKIAMCNFLPYLRSYNRSSIKMLRIQM